MCSSSQKPLRGSRSCTCLKDKTYQHQRETLLHVSGTPQTVRTISHSAASKVANQFVKSRGLCMQAVAATSKPTLPKQVLLKTPTGHNHRLWTYHSPKITNIFQQLA